MSQECFGVGYGQTAVTTSPTKAINGLTVSRLMTVYAPSTNAVSVYIGNLQVTTGTGYVLEAGKNPTTIDTNNRNDVWYVVASSNGATLTYVSTEIGG